MKTAGVCFLRALAFLLAAHAVAAQGHPAERIASSWTSESVSGEGQPRGYVEYQKYCSACHGQGLDHPGTLALTAKYKGALPAMLEKRTDLTPALVKAFVRNGDTVMPIFRKTEISDADLDLIASYLARNSKP
jgi:mono/diheme cytochrome c family protein